VVRDTAAVGVGARVAEERKVGGLTQRQLAERAHVSLSLLRATELIDRFERRSRLGQAIYDEPKG
jgi:transcriptional regulator with XRE-family HTH domain